MADKVIISKDKLDSLADSINSKAGTSGNKNIDELKETVDGIETGGELPFEISYVEIGETKVITAEEIIKLYVPSTNPMDVILIFANNNSGINNYGNIIWAFRTSDGYLTGNTRRGGDNGDGTSALGHQWNVTVGATLKIIIIPNSWRYV